MEYLNTVNVSNLLRDLTETRKTLWQEVEGLNDTQLNTKPKREKWSIMQNLHHLYLSEQAVTSTIIYALQKSERKPVKAKPVHLTVNRFHKAEAPEQLWPTETIMKRDEIRTLLEHSREQLLDVLQSITDEKDLTDKSIWHPIFEELSLYQWFEFLISHERRHTEQIQEAKVAIVRK
ncbi:DinB family protein [Bacillus sp. 165]|uniref:DinB family protein n=1 Tax=Bacillus sp. 165 TaxID=1529117 RepID=UPI001AD9828F|nr:DinB family protein [Bacillus sp. 165]MBO9128441.1 DinB family protein [Bacillus sp. 165]